MSKIRTTEKNGNGKNDNGKLGYRKIGQRENSAGHADFPTQPIHAVVCRLIFRKYVSDEILQTGALLLLLLWFRLGCVSVTTEGYLAVAMRDDVTTGSSNGGPRRVAVVESLAGRLVGGCDVKPASSKSELPVWPYGIATTDAGQVRNVFKKTLLRFLFLSHFKRFYTF